MTKAKVIAERLKGRVKQLHTLVPLERAVFGWNHEPVGEGEWPEEAFVVLDREMQAPEVHDLSSSTGGDSEGWPNAPYNNPGFVFGQLIFRTWKSETEKVEAIAEFAKIADQDWAREILRGIAYNLAAFERDDDLSYWRDIKTIADVELFRDAILERIEESD